MFSALRLQHLQELLEIFEFCSIAMHCPRKLLSGRTRANQDLDFCTLMTVVDRRAVNVRSFSNSCTWMCSCTSHLETRLAPGVIRGMACSLVKDLFCQRHHSFRNTSFVFVLSSFEVSQHSSHDLQLAFQHQGSYGMCISRRQKAYNVECVLISFT